jgi:hypothetical protein
MVVDIIIYTRNQHQAPAKSQTNTLGGALALKATSCRRLGLDGLQWVGMGRTGLCLGPRAHPKEKR